MVWANTTFVPEGEPGRFVGDDVKYNAIAEKIMKDRGIVINDLHALSASFSPEMFTAPGDVHFKRAASNQLGKQVAEVIKPLLPPPSAPVSRDQL